MKELSIEQKAEAYDKAIERAVNIRTGKCKTTFIFTEGLFNYLFPELEECNEEEVRKAMIDFFKHEREEDVVVSHYGVNIERMIAWLEKQGTPQDKGEISDGYHTFNELYYYRMLYNAAFFNMLPKEWVHKSKKHHDGEDCFGGGWFIVMANLPTGQVSNHYELKNWDLFQIPEKEVADKWDGHTPQEAADRLHKYLLEKQGKLLDQIHYWTEEEIEPIISDYLRGAEHYGGMIGRLRCLKPKSLEKQDEQNLIMAKSPQLGEQKPADKVEPKFKIGDVVCDKSCTTLDKNVQPNYEIVDIKNGMYFCNEGVIPIEHQDQFELVAKKIEPKFHEKNWSADDYLWQITCKEQCDLLYTKIKEAGYEWDDEKKEFKKIKNPAWSEKDEAVVKDICDKLSWLRMIYTGNQNIACQKDIYWLKSLKGRVGCEANFTTMWKPSEKQIMCLQDALSDYHRRGYKAETLETLLKQLKQL